MSESYIQDIMRRMLRDQVLTELVMTGPVRAFYLHRKEAKVQDNGQLTEREGSTFFLFTPEGVVITGDLYPPRQNYTRGCISEKGYGLAWFVGPLGEDYLCEKFLERGIFRDNVQAWLEEFVKQTDDPLKKGIAEQLVDDMPLEDEDAKSFLIDALAQLGEDNEGQALGYNPSTAGWLCALQQRFAELFRQANLRP